MSMPRAAMSVATSTRDIAAAERFQGALARILGLVAMDGVGLDAVLRQMLGDAVGAVLGAGEDDDAVHRLVLQQLQPAAGASAASSTK